MSLATLMAQLSPRHGLEAGLGVLAGRPSLYPGGPGCFLGASRWGAGGLSAGRVWGLLPCEPSAPQASFWQLCFFFLTECPFFSLPPLNGQGEVMRRRRELQQSSAMKPATLLIQ